MTYVTLKYAHVASITLSYLLFFIRGVWMMQDSPVLARKWVKIAPHAVDTVLLATGVALSVMLAQYPFVQGWITAKVGALVLYMVLGTWGLKRGETKRDRVVAWIAAHVVFFYMVGVSLTKSTNPVAGLF
jgi:uncharacterized membrane protein SirB2